MSNTGRRAIVCKKTCNLFTYFCKSTHVIILYAYASDLDDDSPLGPGLMVDTAPEVASKPSQRCCYVVTLRAEILFAERIKNTGLSVTHYTRRLFSYLRMRTANRPVGCICIQAKSIVSYVTWCSVEGVQLLRGKHDLRRGTISNRLHQRWRFNLCILNCLITFTPGVCLSVCLSLCESKFYYKISTSLCHFAVITGKVTIFSKHRINRTRYKPSVNTQRRIFDQWVNETHNSLITWTDHRQFWPFKLQLENQGANYKKILRLSYDVIITYGKSNLR